ncbi:MAG TPA: DEAD/DEAH box helicase, partial [Pyrinomonadaceae bacterium]|nr:DEAD/DEAH box helicase [Pyrinomonadaceae bacterium]
MTHPAQNTDEALAALRKFFGFEGFREGQREVIDAILAGHDTVVVMPTGGGKSLCYQLPALMKDGVTVVVSPLIALMKDQVDALQARGLPATFVNSSLDFEEQKERIAGVRRGAFKLLYVAPERFRSQFFV